MGHDTLCYSVNVDSSFSTITWRNNQADGEQHAQVQCKTVGWCTEYSCCRRAFNWLTSRHHDKNWIVKIRQSSLPFHYQPSSSSEPFWDTRTEIQPTNSNQPTCKCYLFDISLKIILASIPWFSNWCSPFKYCTFCIYRLSHADHMVWPRYDPHFDHRNTRHEEQ